MQNIAPTRTVSVEVIDNEGNTESVRVVYYSPDLRGFRARAQEGKKAPEPELDENKQIKNFPEFVLQFCLMQIKELPDLVGENEKPIPVTEENLISIGWLNLLAIYTAIQGDITPKSQPAKSTSTTKAAGDTENLSQAIEAPTSGAGH